MSLMSSRVQSTLIELPFSSKFLKGMLGILMFIYKYLCFKNKVTFITFNFFLRCFSIFFLKFIVVFTIYFLVVTTKTGGGGCRANF